MSRFVDRGAVVAAYVGIGMAVTLGISFLLVIPIEPIYWYLSLPAGVLIGYYANQRSDRRAGPWPRIVANATFAGLVTGLTVAIFLLAIKAMFFFADTGYRDASAGGNLTCGTGADCVWQRYVAERGPALVAAGITDAAAFSRAFWESQASTAGTLLVVTLGGGIAGGVLYGVFRPRRRPDGSSAAESPIG